MSGFRTPSIGPSLYAGNTGCRWAVALLGGALLFLAPRPSTAAPGDLDPTFNGTGKVTTAVGPADDMSNSLAVQPDGKILMTGYASRSADVGSIYDVALVRYNVDGSLDTNFNGTGKVITVMGIGRSMGNGVAVQADGKILVGGRASDGTNHFAVARYHTNGVMDTTFGTNGNGKVITHVGTVEDYGESVAVQADGKIVVAGFAKNVADYDFAVVRYHTNGVLDTSFGAGGKVITPFSGDDRATSVAVQSDGKIVVAGYAGSGGYDFAVARYTTGGNLDPAFGAGTGKASTPIRTGADYGQAVAIQSDGKILVAGTTYTGTNDDVAVVRYSTVGALDTTFGTGGKVVTPVGAGNDSGEGIALQSDGKILVAGSCVVGTIFYFGLVRYNTNGVLDTTFGTGGKVTTPFGAEHAVGEGMSVQADGKILVGGSYTYYASGDFALARYDSGDPEIAVEQPAGTNLVDGAASVAFGTLLTGATSNREFTLKNTGFGSTLTGMGITFDGTNAADFSVTASPATAVGGPNGSTTFTVRFAPAIAGSKSAALHIASNDGDENPFDINLTGRGLAPDADEDGDGVTNEAEVNMASLGFDPLVDSSSLRDLIHDNALGMDLYRASDMRALALGYPLLEKDPGTGHFHLTIGIETSQSLGTWLPLTGFSPTYDEPAGLIDIDITPDGSSRRFFRVIGKEP